MEMVSVEMTNHLEEESRRSKATFVQFYPDMLKECDRVMEKAKLPDIKSLRGIIALKTP